MSLILSIKCIIPKKIQKVQSLPIKDYTIRIYNREMNLHMQIENNFKHNYQYIFKLWPYTSGEGHTIDLQLKEQIGGALQFRGRATAKILYSTSGDLYKFHGNRQENEMFLMKFYLEQLPQETNEQVMLKKMNQEMEQNLQKYRREIQNYQEFLYFTNNVIKELNDDVPANRDDFHSDLKQETRPIDLSGRNISPQTTKERQVIEETARAQSTRPQNKVFPNNLQLINIKDKHRDSNVSQKQQNMYSGGKSQKSSQVSVSRTNKARSFLSKYRYLQEQDQQEKQDTSVKNEEKRQGSPSGLNTPINILRQEIPEQRQSEDQHEKSYSHIQISNQIKQRRQQYFVNHQRKSSNSERRSIQTPILRLSTDMSSHPRHQQFHQRSAEEVNTKEVKVIQVNHQPYGKVSTRSQTGLEDMKNKMDKEVYLQDKPIQNNNISTNDPRIRGTKASLDNQKDYQIIQTVNVSINEKKRSQSSQNDVGRQSSRKITRRKKTVGNNQMNSSAINDSDKIEDIRRTSKIQKSIVKPVPSPNQGFVTKITIFNIQSLFYTNFKNTIKKCIIEHNHQVYQTQMEQNNLKETSWGDRIVISSISPSEQIIFQVYSLRMNQINLQGSAIVNINQILAKQDRHIKLYLYYEDIAVGSIKFDLQRQQRSYKRLTISLPEIKGKQPTQPEIKPKTIRNSIFPSEVSKVQSRISNERFLHPSIKCRKSFPSQSQQHSMSNDMTSKIRNMKLQRRNRLK